MQTNWPLAGQHLTPYTVSPTALVFCAYPVVPRTHPWLRTQELILGFGGYHQVLAGQPLDDSLSASVPQSPTTLD